MIPPSLVKADIPIIVYNPLTTPLSFLHNLTIVLKNPNAIIILTCIPSSQEVLDRVQSLLAQAGVDISAKLIFVDPERALTAIQSLRDDPKASRNVQVYQRDYTDSNIGSVNSSIAGIVERVNTVTTLRQHTAHILIGQALEVCRETIENAEGEVDAVCARVSDLRGRIEEAKARVRGEILGREGTDEVQKAMKEAEKEMRVVMGELTWLKMIRHVDEIGELVGNAVRRAWCKELEHKVRRIVCRCISASLTRYRIKLIFHTGRLSALQDDLTSSAILLPTLVPSPLLQNTLSQLTSSPSYYLRTSTLTAPLQTRQDQLMNYPTIRLHLAAQNAVLGILGGIIGGGGAAAYVLGLGSGASIAGSSGVGTATGILLLSTLFGVRWAVGKWERAKKRWWEDWSRVGQGLERDLEVSFSL